MILNTSFRPGELWLDTDGKPIQAHGGGMLFVDGVYYWFGENKGGENYLDESKGFLHRVDVIGISCYSSTDLLNWKNKGVVLHAEPNNPQSDLHPSKVLERPKVIRNPKTGKYVLFAHVDTADYEYARIGIAISDKPTGPYTYLGSIRPNGNDSRDMTVFQDDDGAAYLFFSSEWNKTLHIIQLDDEYLRPTQNESRAFIDQSREAPAVFKRNGKYYLISSGCTGWDPNRAELAVADSPLGPWTMLGDPCIGKDSEITFYAQSTFVFPLAGRKDSFIAMFDRWNKDNLRDSRYVWLPIQFDGDQVKIHWRNEWDLSVFD
jgi:Glycosyl hydrolases family 43